MDYLDVIKNVDTTQVIDFHGYVYAVMEDLGFYNYVEQSRLGTREHTTWTCTDTMVGLFVLYLDKEPVAILFKPFRKSDIEIYWVSVPDCERVSRYVHGLSYSMGTCERAEGISFQSKIDAVKLRGRK